MDVPEFESTSRTRVPGLNVTLDRAGVAVPRVRVDPQAAQRRRSPWATVAFVVLVIDLALLGFSFAVGAVEGIRRMFDPSPETGGAGGLFDDPVLLWWNALLVTVMMGLVPMAWVYASRRDRKAGFVRYLGLHRFRRSLFVGVGLAGLMLAGVFVILSFFAVTGLPTSPRPVGEGPSSLNWPLVLAVSLAAGFGEEVLFRGLLQRWTGWVGQGVLFAVGHLASGEPLQFAVTLGAGLVFGRLRALGWSLWTFVTAHVVYDLFLLGMQLLSAS